MFKLWTFIKLPYFDSGSIVSSEAIMYFIYMVLELSAAGGCGTEKLEGIFKGSFISNGKVYCPWENGFYLKLANTISLSYVNFSVV